MTAVWFQLALPPTLISYMKITRLLPVILAATMLANHLSADFHDHLGLQLWSLRATTNDKTKGLPVSLDLMKGWGFTEIEGGIVTEGLTPEQVRAMVDARGLTMPSAHVPYDLLGKDLAGAVRAAQTLGVKYVICPWIPHESGFDAATMQRAAELFNKAGEAFRAAGIKFGYHPHGYEFVPGAKAGDTLLDDLIRTTKPENVCYEMDVFWVVHGGGNPLKLFEKYPTRWVALHVKDIRKGATIGFPTAKAPDTDNVTVGDGQIDWKAVIGAAQKIGIQYYFIEDETPFPMQCIPASLAYLKALKI